MYICTRIIVYVYSDIKILSDDILVQKATEYIRRTRPELADAELRRGNSYNGYEDEGMHCYPIQLNAFVEVE